MTIAEAHGWGTHRIVAPAVAAGAARAGVARSLRRGRAVAGPRRACAGAGRGARDRARPPLRARLRAAWAGPVRGGAGGVPRRGEDAALLAREHALPSRGARLDRHYAGSDGRHGGGARRARRPRRRRARRRRDAHRRRDARVGGRPPAGCGGRAGADDRGRAGPGADGAPQVLNLRWATVHALLLDAVARDQLGDRRATPRHRSSARSSSPSRTG